MPAWCVSGAAPPPACSYTGWTSCWNNKYYVSMNSLLHSRNLFRRRSVFLNISSELWYYTLGVKENCRWAWKQDVWNWDAWNSLFLLIFPLLAQDLIHIFLAFLYVYLFPLWAGNPGIHLVMHGIGMYSLFLLIFSMDREP